MFNLNLNQIGTSHKLAFLTNYFIRHIVARSIDNRILIFNICIPTYIFSFNENYTYIKQLYISIDYSSKKNHDLPIKKINLTNTCSRFLLHSSSFKFTES